jgi:Kef-type K+ transport system membrane component KefB
MKVKIGFKEILFLTIFFTGLAIYFDIHREHHVLTFIINHIIALLLALVISKVTMKLLTNRNN